MLWCYLGPSPPLLQRKLWQSEVGAVRYPGGVAVRADQHCNHGERAAAGRAGAKTRSPGRRFVHLSADEIAGGAFEQGVRFGVG